MDARKGCLIDRPMCREVKCDYWGMPLQVVKLIVMVASRWWVADGGAVFLGNAMV